jgi:hypothetical protein
MAWKSSGNLTGTLLHWEYNAIEDGMTRRNYSPTTLATLWRTESYKTFNPNKNYQFITKTDNFGDRSYTTETFSKFLDIQTPWGTTFSYRDTIIPDTIGGAFEYYSTKPFSGAVADLVYYSRPPSEIGSNDMIQYKSTYDGFGNPASDPNGLPVIEEFKLVEFDWFIQGWALEQNLTPGYTPGNRGWSYFESDNSFWFSAGDGDTLSFDINDRTARGYVYPNFSNSEGDVKGGFTQSNYIARYISYPKFNISFNVETSANVDSYVDVWLIPSSTFGTGNLKTLNLTQFNTNLDNGQFLGRIHDTGDGLYNFYDLDGDQYILISGNYTGASIGYTKISNIAIDGAYQETDNNEQFLFTNSGTYSEPTDLCILGGSADATYSVVVINDDTQHEIVGSPSTFYGATGFPGFFSNLYGQVINLNSLSAKVGNGRFKAGVWENGVWNSGWRVDTEIYEFDDVKISLLMKTTNTIWRIEISGTEESTSQFSIGDKVSIGNIVGIDINENRKLMKNYFTVLSVNQNSIIVDFNNTFPLRRIEKDSENHKIKISKNIWLNGGFLNGYFEGIWNNGLFKGFPFITEMYNTHWIDGKYDGGHFYGEYPENAYADTYYISNSQYSLGLTFGATAHGFAVGDLISIDKSDKLLNPQYDGNATVIDVIDEHLILVDKNFGASSTLEGGVVRRRTGTAVIQNFEFYDNNVATQTIKETSELQSVYTYNSWIDVKYLNESATNLGRSQVIYSPDYGEYPQNNLYGHITEDVLDSVSSFRNSHNLNKTIYSLGTKYSIYEDFLGDISEFNEPFGTLPINGGFSNFIDNGWTYSLNLMLENQIDITRTPDELLRISITDPNIGIFGLENSNVNIEKNRYSMIEFDLIEFTSSVDEVLGLPSIYLLNTINIPGFTTPAFPDQEFVYHNRTSDIRKYEYFYNRRGLDILLLNLNGLTASFDNIKIYETDKAPFFKYLTYDYVNKSIQVPYQGVAPFIDYSDNEFSFIDNIDIGLDSLSTIQSFNPPSGGGGGESPDDNTIFSNDDK